MLPLIDALNYHFHDASTPPPCHRSYVIRLTANRLVIVVDSYGDIVSQGDYVVDATVLAGALEILANAEFALKTVSEDLCVGGSYEHLELVQGGCKILEEHEVTDLKPLQVWLQSHTPDFFGHVAEA